MTADHHIRWFVWGHGSQGAYKIPHTARMRGTWGWDAECSCGWKSRTGGATRRSVEHDVWGHKFDHGLHKWQQETQETAK